jgi:exodeoxyribonuclease V beta subunit
MTLRPWQESEPLPERSAWLLEASAGTGKTYQIAGLVLRLVAEYGLPIERILTITFTNAATAELRDRVRRRLSRALSVLEDGGADPDDKFIAHLLDLQTPARDTLILRLRIALRDFDLAAISTIHGFSQRMLKELAFDSGQDSDLELLADPAEIFEELVDDELARLFHGVSAEEIALYRAAGMDRAMMMKVARAMCGAVEPVLTPSRSPGAAPQTLARLRAFRAECAAMHATLTTPASASALRRLVDTSEQFSYGNRIEGRIEKVIAWLDAGAILPTDERTANAIGGLSAAELRAAFEQKLRKGGDKDALTREPYWPLILALDVFVDAAGVFWNDFAPLADFAAEVRGRFDAALRRRRVLTFDTMLSRLAERFRAEGGATSDIARRVRERYEAVLVDEFQDTDAAQWSVLQAAFLGHRRLMLIGDPKQAIYAFRGADVHVYTQAAGTVDGDRRRTMSINYRSDQRVLDALNMLWRPGSDAFDAAGFDYVKVSPPGRAAPAEPDAPPGLEIRWLDARAFGGAPDEPVSKKRSADLARLAAAEVVDSLSSTDGRAPPRVARASGLAVLVNSHAQASVVQRALRDAKVPAVAATRSTVVATEVAQWLATWLDAVAAAGRDREARAAVVTPLFGWTAADLAWALVSADEGGRPWQRWTARLHDAASAWPRWGFARVFDREVVDLDVMPRLLAMPDGERLATDLRHLFELVHAEERSTRKGPAALAAWIRAEAEVEDQARAQRLESDAEAVRIETIHASKGLQYGHVLLPYTWDVHQPAVDAGPIVIREGGVTRVDLTPESSPVRDAARAAASDERRREDLRKLYVALTRAERRNVAWYGPMGRDGQAAAATAMGRLLLRAPETLGHVDGALPDFKKPGKSKGAPKPDPAAPGPWVVARARLESLTVRSGGAAVWSPVSQVRRDVFWRSVQPPATVDPQVAAWPADRPSLRGAWMVTSYTGLAARSAVTPVDGEGNATTEGELERDDLRAGRDERPAVIAASSMPPLVEITMPRGDGDRLKQGRGTGYGTFVHEVFEGLDLTTACGKDGEGLRELVQRSAERNGLAADPRIADELVVKLPTLLATPLDTQDGTLADPVRGLPTGFTLAQIGARDRLDELEFNLRLGAGARYARTQPVVIDPARVEAALASALDETRLAPPEIQPVGEWLAHHLDRARHDGAPLFEQIAGILTGSIDLVFRAHPDAAQRAAGATDPRWFIVDYKTNAIETSTPGHFTGPWLAWKMATTGYPLQALLYTVALHRHLRLRMGERYDYDRHIGGYLYLFVRGMAGPDTPRCAETGRCLGVFAHRWSKRTIELMDAALGGDAAGADASRSGR